MPGSVVVLNSSALSKAPSCGFAGGWRLLRFNHAAFPNEVVKGRRRTGVQDAVQPPPGLDEVCLTAYFSLASSCEFGKFPAVRTIGDPRHAYHAAPNCRRMGF